MSSNTYATPLHIDLLPSRALTVLLILAHSGAVVWLFFLPIPWWLSALLAVGIVASGYWYIDVFALRRSPRSLARLVWREGDDWLCQRKDGTQTVARLMPGAFVHPWLVVVPLQPEQGRRLHCALFFDAVSADVARRLRVRLLAFHEFNK